MLFFVPLVLSAAVEPLAERSFVSWMRSNGVLFVGTEYHLRFGIYMSNARYVRAHNAHHSYKLSLNRFAASTTAEYRLLLTARPRLYHEITISRASRAAPASVDWRNNGSITYVRDQGLCGSAWSISAVQAIESAYQISGGQLYNLSAQNLIDCDNKSSYGCEGGLPQIGVAYVIAHQDGQVMTEADYPYQQKTGLCVFDPSRAVANVTGIISVTSGDENDLRDKIAESGPAMATIDASLLSFQLYQSGVYDDPSCSETMLAQSVQIVGYGKDDTGGPYWIVKNSFGDTWGESGYIRIARGHDECGIAQLAAIAVT
jgi:cathepsin L